MSLDSLNAAQKDAVLATEGPLIVVAGAGAGKTKTITHRIWHLIQNGVLPREILAITFTNKAAGEMRERIGRMLGAPEGVSGAWSDRVPFVSTFHALGVFILREHGERLGYPRNFSILDRDEAISTLKRAIKAVGFDPKQFEPSKLLGAISRNKGNLITAEKMIASTEQKGTVALAALVWPKYEEIMRANNLMDFDDLLLKTVILLKNHPDILAHYHDRWKYIHIDEYQDTNAAQYELSHLLAAKHKNICVVGDGDQTIYSWRGANFRNILNFETHYPGSKSVLLEENYRSTKTILAAANAIIRKNKERKDKNLFTSGPEGKKITLHAGMDENFEANHVAQSIVELVDASVSPKNIAILYRANFQSRALEEALLRHRIPYQLLGTRFFERKEIKDVLSFVKLALNEGDVESLKRVINVPPRGIGKTTLDKIIDKQEASLPPKMREKLAEFRATITDIRAKVNELKVSELLVYILNKTKFEAAFSDEEEQDRIENLRELTSLATKYDAFPAPEGIERLLTDASLMSDQDTMKEEKDAVRLMTVHASKGLEFGHVFITGLEQDLFPHKRFDEVGIGREREEEERRLFYVAVTRAKDQLHLSYAQSRMMYGSRGMNIPSEFLNDIPKNLLELDEGTYFAHDNEPEEVIEWDFFKKRK